MSDEGEDPSPRPKRKVKKVMVLSSAASSDSDDSGPTTSTRKKRLRVLSEEDSDTSSGSWAMGVVRRRRALPGLRDSDGDSDSSEWATDQSDAPQTTVPSASPPASNSPSVNATKASGFSSDSSEGNSEKCSICLMKFLNQEVGTPQNCEHIFCLDCITEWSKNMNTCPVDRISFDSIVVRAFAGGRVLRTEQVVVAERRPSLEMMIIEDPTVCEVCHNADREESMLLCDGCDLGFHMHCLTPPLTRIPEDQWLCPNCNGVWRSSPIFFPMQSSHSFNTFDTYERPSRATRGDDEPSTSSGRGRGAASRDAPSSSRSSRALGGGASGSARRATAPRTTTPRTRKRTYKRRKTRTVIVEYEVEGEGKFPITKTRRVKTRVKKRKIKKRQPRTAARRTHVRASVRAKLATLRGAPPAPARAPAELAVRRAGAGIPALSLFGSAHQLDYFEEEEQDSGGAGAARASRPTSAVLSAYRQARRKMLSIPSPSRASAAPDLLSDILASQARLHCKHSVLSVTVAGDVNITIQTHKRDNKPKPDKREDTPLADKKGVDLTKGEGTRQAPLYPGQGRGWGGGYRYPRDTQSHDQGNQGYGRGGYGNGYGGAQRGPGGPGGHGGPGGPGAYQDRRDDNNGHFNDYHNRRPHQYSNDDEPWPDRNRRHQPDQNRGPNNNLGDERRYSGGPGWRPQRRPDGPLHRQSFGGFENPLDMRMGHEPPHTGPGVSRSHSFPEDSWDKPQPYRPHLQPPTSELDNSQPSNLEFDNSEPPTLEFDNSQPPNLEFGNYQPTTLEFDSSEPPTLDFDNSQPPNVEFDNSQPPTFEFDNSITPGIDRDKSEDEKSDEGLIIDTEKYDPTEPTHDDDSWGDDSAVPASQVPACSSATPTPPALSPGRLPALSPGRLPSPPAPPILPLGCLRSPPTPPELPPLPLPPPPLPPDTPSVETILAGIDTRAIDVPADVLDSAVRQVLQEHRALMAPGDRGDCPNFSIYSATSVHIATDSSRLVPDKPLLRRNSLEDLVQEDGELTPPEPFAPLDLVDDAPTVSPTKATYGLVQQSAEEYKAKVSKRCPITINTRNPIKIKLNTPSLIKRQVSLYDDEDISQELDKNAEPTAEPHQQTTTEAVSATDESKEEKDPSESEAERGISTEEKNDPIDDKEGDDGTSTPHISDEDATPKRLDKDLDDDRTDDELDTDDVSSHSGRSARAAKMTESISETEDERSYTPCLDENKSKDASLEDKGIEGLDTEMISEEEGNDMFSEGSAATAGAGTPLPEEGEILDKRPKNDDTKKKKKKESKKEKEGKSKGRKRSDVAFKKIGKGKERNYREREKEKEKRRSPASSRDRRRRKDKRKDLERYDVRTLVTERRRRPKDAFGRDVSPSGSRSPSPADPPPRLGSASPAARRALSPSPRRARLSPSPRRARSSLSPRRGRLSPSPRRGRLSPSPRRGRLSPSPRRGRFSPSPLRRRASVSPIRPRLSPSPRRARISPSPRRRLSPSPRRARLASLSPRRRPTSAASPRRSPSPKRRRKRSGSRPKPARRPRSASRRKRRRSASPALTPKPTKTKKKKRARSPRRRSPRRKRVRRRSASPPAPPLAAAAWSPPPLSPRTPPPAEPIPLEERRRRREVERAHRRMREAAGPSKEVFTSGDNILVSVSFKEQERAEGIGRRERRKERRRRRRRVAGEPEAGPKPIAIIDLERSPFRELTPSPKNIIVLSDDEAPAAAAAPEPAPAAAQGPKTPPDPAEPAPAPAPAAAPSLEEGRGPLTPPEPPDSPDAYDPFEPTRSASNSPGAAAGPPPAADDAERPSMTLEAAQKTNLSADEVLDRRPLSPIEKVMALLQSTRDVSPEEPAQREAGASPGGGLADAPGPTAAVAPAPRAALSEQPRPPLKLFLAKPSPIKSDPIKPMPQATKISRLPLPSVRRRSESDGGGASPYSPGSSDFGDLFEPPHQPVRPRKGRNGRFGKRAKRGKKTVNVRLDDDSLQIVDELPSSAVEMQLKSKFLKKLNRQERVVEEVKLLLKPHYNKKHVSKDEYKHILRRAVPKICHNKTGEINPTKIQALVEAYVKKFRKKRKLGQ